MPYVLQTNRLTKAIGGKNIVEDVNLHVNPAVDSESV